MSFERVGVLSQLIRNTTKKWIAKINFWGHKGMYQGLCCFCWQVLSYIRELCYFNWRRLIYRMSLHALPISWQWRVSNTASMIFRAVFDGLITASPTVTGGNRWGAIMIFCIENQKLCLRSVQFKQVLRYQLRRLKIRSLSNLWMRNFNQHCTHQFLSVKYPVFRV